MKIKDVLISKDAVNDLDDGKSFYDNKEILSFTVQVRN